MKPPARCTICRGAFDPPVWEHFEPILRKYVGEMRCHDCGRAYLYSDDVSHGTTTIVNNDGDQRHR